MRKVPLYLFYVAVTWFVLPSTKILAAPFDSNYRINPIESGSSSIKSFADLVDFILNNIIFFAVGAGAVIFVIIGGIRYVTAGGDETKSASARKTIINAVIGLIIVSSLWLIYGTVTRSTGAR